MIVLIFLTVFLFVFIAFAFATGRFVYAVLPLAIPALIAYKLAVMTDDFNLWFPILFLGIGGAMLAIRGYVRS